MAALRPQRDRPRDRRESPRSLKIFKVKVAYASARRRLFDRCFSYHLRPFGLEHALSSLAGLGQPPETSGCRNNRLIRQRPDTCHLAVCSLGEPDMSTNLVTTATLDQSMKLHGSFRHWTQLFVVGQRVALPTDPKCQILKKAGRPRRLPFKLILRTGRCGSLRGNPHICQAQT
jgi:hypothetical protein